MALIKCPECGREISDKASVCINCGYPINEIPNIQNEVYSIKYCGYKPESNKIEIIKVLRSILDLDIRDAKVFIESPPHLVKSGLSNKDASAMKQNLEQKGCMIQMVPLVGSNPIDEEFAEKERFKNLVACPRCGSTAITTGQRGFNLMTGFLGSNKTVNRCGKCGYTWEPKR